MCSVAVGAQERLRRLSVLGNQWRLLGGVSVRSETWGAALRSQILLLQRGLSRSINWVPFVRYLVGLLLQVFRRIISLGATMHLGFLGDSDDKESASHAGDLGSIPGSGRSPGEENGYPLQYSCLGKPMDRGACTWSYKASDMIEWLMQVCILGASQVVQW